jgi:hypothetical protein
MGFDLSGADASFTGEDAYDYSGTSVAGAGDINGDGADDFLIGAYGDDDGGGAAGQTYLLLGTPFSEPSPPLPVTSIPTLSQWGMIGMAVVFAVILVWMTRRRIVAKTATDG